MRWVIAITVGLLLAFVVMRQALVTAYAGREPAKAAALWPSHPAVQLEAGLAQIGDAAAAGKTTDPALVKKLLDVSAQDPLAPEPFLVRGVQAMIDGNQDVAGKAFIAARTRNPRLVAAHYFLADHYLKLGRIDDGLAEIGALVRLVPQSLSRVAPYLAAYARTAGGAPQVKALLRHHPILEATLLSTLAADPRDSRLVIYLWSGRSDENAKQWQARLLSSLVDAGRFAEARSALSRFGATDDPQLVDSQFRRGRLAPFGWTFATDASGVAESQGPGQLHVLYYGRQDKVLASQLVMLGPGRYRLSMHVSGPRPTAKSLAWKIRCLPSNADVALLQLDGRGRDGKLSAAFVITASGCGAQQIELVGTAPEVAEQAEVRITNLRLIAEGQP